MRAARVLISAFVLHLGLSAVAARPVIEATPVEVVEGEPVNVVLRGLPPKQTVTLHSSRILASYPRGEELFRGRATYVANELGEVDLGSSPPLAGSSYELPDQAGLFWSMAADPGRTATGPDNGLRLASQDELRPGQVRLEAEIEGQIVARVDIGLLLGAEDVAVQEVREAGVVGVFARDQSSEPQPAVIVLGGSEGGLYTARWAAPLLASHGYSVLGLAYFQGGEPELSTLAPNLEHISLETVEAARNWLSRQPGVDPDRIAIVGVSKGAELALLAGSTFPWVSVVGAFAPSHVVWEGVPPDDQSDRSAGSSWTFRNRALPYVRWSKASEQRGDVVRSVTGSSRLTEVHLESLAEYATDVDAATIPIEQSDAAVFIAAGSDDAMWPSAYSAEKLRERLALRDPKLPSHFELHNTGHLILGTGWAPTTQFQRRQGRLQGGSAQLDSAAQRVIWPAFLRFLEHHLIDTIAMEGRTDR